MRHLRLHGALPNAKEQTEGNGHGRCEGGRDDGGRGEGDGG